MVDVSRTQPGADDGLVTEVSARLRAIVGPDVGIVVARRVRSTNDLLRRIAGEYADDGAAQPAAIVVALSQTAGRGRLGRRWESPAGAGVYASLLRPMRLADLAVVPLLLATTVARALAPFTPDPVGIKWPNDVLLQGRKVAGVLIETTSRGSGVQTVAGIGVNLTPDAAHPVSAASLGHNASLVDVATAVVAAAWAALAAPPPLEVVLASWRELAVHRPGDRLEVRLAHRSVTGTYVGLADSGHLVIDCNGERCEIAAGEILEGES